MLVYDFDLIEKTTFGDILLHKEFQVMALVYKESCNIDLEMAKCIADTVYPIIKMHKIELFISDNSANYITSTPEARTFLSNNKSLQLMKAHAVIVKYLPVKLLVDSFIKNNKPVVPIKSFKLYENAIEWLHTFQEVNSSKVPSL